MDRPAGAMRINRLLEITTILLNRRTITASELANRFGVSTRTIYRDIDVLSSSGIPVYSTQGMGGGISLLENFTIQKNMLTEKECESMLLALKSLQATRYPEVDAVLEKLGQLFKSHASDWISIDYSTWSSSPNAMNRLGLLKDAVLGCRMCEFDYISADNRRSHRVCEPLRLIFKGHTWYLWAWSPEKEGYRTFRVSRIKSLALLDEVFDRSRKREPRREPESGYSDEKPPVELKLCFTAEALYRLYDDYDDEYIIPNGDGTYSLTLTFPEDDWVYGYLMSFGPHVKVLDPAHIRDIIMEKMKKTIALYE